MNKLVFIPGLGDGRLTNLQNWYVKRWTSHRQAVVCFSPKWASSEPYAEKYSRLIDSITQLRSMPDTTSMSLVAVSAGGSLAVRVMSEVSEMSHAHIICGKNQGAATIGAAYRKRAPALYDAVLSSETSLEHVSAFQDKVTVYQPRHDEVVPLENMLVGTAPVKTITANSHTTAIAAALVFMVPHQQ